MKRIAPILALIALLAAYHTAGVLWGRDAKLYALIGMLVLYALLTLALFVMRRRLRREQPDLAADLDDDVVTPWYWRLLDGVLGVAFAIIPPLFVSLASSAIVVGERVYRLPSACDGRRSRRLLARSSLRYQTLSATTSCAVICGSDNDAY